ncbi:MFS transporter [Rhizobium sp. S163]|uniref:MFS transporter n=1 Tax=Rhizobium sp. S163 TaxID=3055039 RepID=UPI000DBAB87E|nr:MFS transporter [Rhizobium sp. S163]MDM9644803.1 MFS transporter [Rhizobium sp. S163]
MIGPSVPTLSAAFLLSMFFRSYFGVVGPAIASDLSLSPQQYGWLASAFFASFSVLQIPVGMSFDKWGVRFPMAGMMLVGAAGSSFVALSEGYWATLVGQALIGIGCAPIFMGVLYFLGQKYPAERAGRLATTISAIGSAGALLSASPLLWFIEEFGWRSACWSAAAAMAATAITVGFTLGSTVERATKPGSKASRGWLAPLLYLAPICFTLSFGGTFRNAWAAPYVTAVFGDGAPVGTMLTVISTAGIVTSFLVPVLLARMTARTIVVVTYVFGIVFAGLLAASPGLGLVAASVGLSVLYAMGNVHPLVMTEAQALIPLNMRGLALGALNTLVFVGVSAASAVYGEVAGLSLPAIATYRLIFAVTATAIAGALFCYVLFRGRALARRADSGDTSMPQ